MADLGIFVHLRIRPVRRMRCRREPVEFVAFYPLEKFTTNWPPRFETFPAARSSTALIVLDRSSHPLCLTCE